LPQPHKIDSDFAKTIITERMVRGWTRKDLAQKAFLSEAVISDYETGKAIKNTNEMNKIQRAFQRYPKVPGSLKNMETRTK